MEEFCSTQPTANANNSAFNKPVSEVPVLCVHSVGEKINEFPLVKKYVTVGRDPKCDIHINSSTISRNHATLELDENGICTITDLDSLNGTKRNDLRLKSRTSYELRNGDSVHFGEVNCTLQFRQRSILNSPGENVQSKKYNERDSDTGPDALVKSSISSERVLDMETDSSVLSENLLSEVVMDVGEVPCDLLPNSNYFILRPPYSSNSTNLESEENKFHKDYCTGSPPLLRPKLEADISEVHQGRRERDAPPNNEEIHPDLKVNLSIKSNTSQTTVALSTKSSENRHLSYDTTLATPMSLLNKQSSTPCGYSRTNLVLARDSDPGSIVQSLHNDSTVHSSACTVAEESVSSIQESDLIRTVSDKSIFEEDESQKHASIFPDMLNENDEPKVDSICKSFVVQLVNETEKNIANMISRKSQALDTNFSEKCGSEDIMVKPEVMSSEECRSNVLRDRSFEKHSYSNNHDSKDGKLAHSSFEECKNEKICDDITQTVHIPCDNVLCNVSGVNSATTESYQKSDIATDHLSLTPFFDLTPNSLDREISMRVSVSVCKLQETQVDEFKTVKNCSLTTDSAFQNEPCGESRKSITTSNRQSPKNLSNSDSTESVCIKPKVGRKRRACPYNGTEVLIEEEAVGNIRRKSETAKRISSPVKSLRRSSRLSCLRKNEFETRVKVDAIPEESCNSAVADTDAEKYEENVNKRRGRNGPATANSLKSEEKVLEVSVINLSDTSLKTKPDVTKCVYLLFSGVESSVYTSTLRKLGACETSDATLADYVITDDIKRTLKILYSRARGIPIISVDWLKACKRCRKDFNPDPLDFILHYDAKPEIHLLSSKQSLRHCSGLSESFKHEAENTCEVDNFLSGWSFCSTQNVSPPLADLRKLTELAGGHWMSDADLINRVKQKSTQKAVIITTREDYEAIIMGIKPRQRNYQLSKNATSDKSIAILTCALSKLTKVSTDWFLQIIMNRKPPVWPIPTYYRIQ